MGNLHPNSSGVSPPRKLLQEEMKADTKQAIKQVPNSSKVACVLACKQEIGCKGSGLAQDGTWYLFNQKIVENDQEGVSVIVFQDEAELPSDSMGTLLLV